MITKDIKQKIWEHEFYSNGFHRLSGADIYVKNLRVRKNEVIADITLISDIESGHSEVYKNCRYPKGVLEAWKK